MERGDLMKNSRCQMLLKPFLVLMISLLLSVLVVIGFASSMNDLAVFLLAALAPIVYCTAVSYDLKKDGFSIWSYIIIFSIKTISFLIIIYIH